MRELGLAKFFMNLPVRQALESRPIFDPASLDAVPSPWPDCMLLTEEELLGLDDDVSIGPGGCRPRAPWEVLP